MLETLITRPDLSLGKYGSAACKINNGARAFNVKVASKSDKAIEPIGAGLTMPALFTSISI